MAVQFQLPRALIKHSSDPLPPFKRGGGKFLSPPWGGGGSEKLKKGWKYGAGVALLKSVG